MKYIAHRGNLTGRNKDLENTENYIITALNLGFDVEIDVWYYGDQFYLGHDNPSNITNLKFLKKDGLWIHCKNIKALEFLLKEGCHTFFHDKDDCTLTSKGIIWTYPGKELTLNSVAVSPSENFFKNPCDFIDCFGICSDIILNIKHNMERKKV